MENTLQLYRTLFGNRAYVRSVSESAFFLAASTIAIFAAVSYATVHASNHVTDFVLSRVGPFNVRRRSIRRRPHRSSTPFFTAATYSFLATPVCHSSWHLHWHIPQWRMFYLALTAFFGSLVLLGHYHYSIDVLAALFITHGVFQMSCWLFGRDYALFRSSENQAVQRPKRAMRKRFEKWVEAHSRKRPTLVSVGGAGRAPEAFVLRAVGEDSVPTGQSQSWS